MPLAIAPADQLVVHGRSTSSEQRAVQRGVERGEFLRIRRGVFVPTAVWQGLTEQERGMLRLHALVLVSSAPPVFSHWSAALLLGLPVPLALLGTVHRTSDADHAPSQPGVTTHLAGLPSVDVVEVEGLLATGVSRTAVDLAASASFDAGVTVADAALRLLGGTDLGRELLRSAWGRAGARRANGEVEAAVAFADALAESPAESRSRVTMHRLGLPAPVLQHVFTGRHGFVARTDFWFPDVHVVGEADGRQKYVDPTMTDDDPAAVLYAEKVRDESLRELGETPVHWGWREAVDPVRLGARLASIGVLPTSRRGSR